MAAYARIIPLITAKIRSALLLGTLVFRKALKSERSVGAWEYSSSMISLQSNDDRTSIDLLRTIE